MIELHWETVSPEMRQVMAGFARSELGNRFYLAGGTALALQLGHRQSVDLDFFAPDEEVPSLRAPLLDALSSFNPLLADASWGNLVFLVLGVRVGFYGYGYPLVSPLVEAEGTRLASVADIGLMKLDALLGRASRKDFFDLYAICQQISLRELLDYAPQKYPEVRDFEAQAVRRLAYFERAERDAPLALLQPVAWETVKQYFREQAISLGKSWIE